MSGVYANGAHPFTSIKTLQKSTKSNRLKLFKKSVKQDLIEP